MNKKQAFFLLLLACASLCSCSKSNDRSLIDVKIDAEQKTEDGVMHSLDFILTENLSGTFHIKCVQNCQIGFCSCDIPFKDLRKLFLSIEITETKTDITVDAKSQSTVFQGTMGISEPDFPITNGIGGCIIVKKGPVTMWSENFFTGEVPQEWQSDTDSLEAVFERSVEFPELMTFVFIIELEKPEN